MLNRLSITNRAKFVWLHNPYLESDTCRKDYLNQYNYFIETITKHNIDIYAGSSLYHALYYHNYYNVPLITSNASKSKIYRIKNYKYDVKNSNIWERQKKFITNLDKSRTRTLINLMGAVLGDYFLDPCDLLIVSSYSSNPISDVVSKIISIAIQFKIPVIVDSQLNDFAKNLQRTEVGNGS